MSTYPAAIDPQVDVTTGVSYITEPLLEDMHSSAVAVQAELGTDPAGAYPTVRQRLEALDTAIAGKAATAHTHDAAALTSGTLDSARLPFAGIPTGTKYLRDDFSWQAPPSGGSGSFVTPEVWVCSADAPTTLKDAITAAGGYVCDGVADQVQINAAIGLYYVVAVTSDTFTLSLTAAGPAVDITGTGELGFHNLIPQQLGTAGQFVAGAGQLTVVCPTI